MSSESKRTFEIPEEGCLGLLAAGAPGLWAWRRRRAEAEGRDYSPPQPPPAPASQAPSRKAGRKKVLLVGWDAADWKVINPLIDAGLMPTMKMLVERGVMGNLATLDPPMSPMLWTSIATGKTADQHGILGFIEPTPDGKGLRPVLGASRRCKALWNILNQEGFRCHVIGWWPSHPAEPVNGVSVSNLFHRAVADLGEPWPLAPGTVHPAELAETLAELRVHPGELSAEHILPFVPRAAEVDQDTDRRLSSLAKIIAEASSVHAAATWVMEHREWDFMAVYYDAIDHFCHGFMNFHPPQREGIPDSLFKTYSGVVAAGYRFHDMMLERLLELAGPETTVVLVSDHGFHPDHLRPLILPKEPAGPAHQHREQGVFCMAGDGIRRDELVFGASLLDVTPTILTHLGLTLGRDMRGKPLVQAFEQPPELSWVDSWEDVPGDTGMHPPEMQRDPWAEQEATRQLVELGYIEAPGEDAEAAVDRSHREARFYLARVLMGQGRHDEALGELEPLWAQAKELRYGIWLAASYRELKRITELRDTIEELEVENARQREERLAQARERAEKLKEEDPEKYATLRGSAPKPESTDADATDKPTRHSPPGLELLWGQLLLAEGRDKEALERLQRAEQTDPRYPQLHLSIGNAYLKRRRWKEAARAFAKACDIDTDSPAAHHGLAIAHLRRRLYRDAADAALRAVALRYTFPTAHFHLGEALVRLRHYERAAEAFEVCLAQAPGMRPAHVWLERLYRRRLGDPDRAEAHRARAEEPRTDEDSES